MENKNGVNIIGLLTALIPLAKGLFKKTPKKARAVRNIGLALTTGAALSMGQDPVSVTSIDTDNIRLVLEQLTLLIGAITALIAQFKTVKTLK